MISQIARIDAEVDVLELAASDSVAGDGVSFHDPKSLEERKLPSVERWNQLQLLIKSLTIASGTAKPTAESIISVLQRADLTHHDKFRSKIELKSGARLHNSESYQRDLEWILLAKAALHTHSLVFDALTRQIVSVNDQLWYWGDVIDSHRYIALYSVQTSPYRLCGWLQSAYSEVKSTEKPLKDQWQHFYSIVRNVVSGASMDGVRKQIISPLTIVRNEIRQKQTTLRGMKALYANAIGQLLSKSFSQKRYAAHHRISNRLGLD